ncbi:polysaccharide deacetylase family protein [Winogradskyella sp. A3E31]|uniref:polysaccharide deacetylase family protein n=1 Tax=Winogradskyella sp. A3E31 TaxID=3349637 RepID=UPI00398A62EE
MKRLIIIIYGCFSLCSSCIEKPSFIDFTYPGGKYKALVLSYDDGTIQDIELAHLFDQNNLVGTFNLNSGYLGVIRGWPQTDGDTIFQKYVPKDSLLIIYKNHEIAVHGALHKNFTDITNDNILEEVNTDLEVLTQLTNREIISMAYPFGNTNGNISKLIAKTGVINGRTVADTYKFDLPQNYMIWNPTCHDSKALDYLNEYLDLDRQELSLFYVWGHSWEFGDQKRWDNMVEFCEKIGKSNDIWSVGNGKLTQYLQAIKKVQIDSDKITNPQENQAIWLKLSTGIEKLEAGETIEIKL